MLVQDICVKFRELFIKKYYGLESKVQQWNILKSEQLLKKQLLPFVIWMEKKMDKIRSLHRWKGSELIQNGFLRLNNWFFFLTNSFFLSVWLLAGLFVTLTHRTFLGHEVIYVVDIVINLPIETLLWQSRPKVTF